MEEGNLAQAISVLRKALGESHQSHQTHEYIETVARRGYRFIAKVTLLDRAEDARRADTVETGETSAQDARVPNEDAHRLRMRGRYYWSKYTVEGLKKGIDYFRQAIKIDPDYAPAYIGLADCFYRLSNLHLPPRKAMPKAKAAVMKALKIDDTLAEAHAMLALIKMFYDRDWPAAENEFKRAIELAPNCAVAHRRYGLHLALTGWFDEAIAEMRRALDLEPLSPQAHIGMGTIFHLARRYDAAIAQAQLALDIEPDLFGAHALLGMAYAQQLRFREAIAEFQEAAALADVPWTLGYLGYAYGVSGRRRQASKVLTELEKRSERAYVSPFAMALVHTGLGHKESALQSLVKTYKDRNEMLAFVKTSPELDGLRLHQRFATLLSST